jgi:hypothetical protein
LQSYDDRHIQAIAIHNDILLCIKLNPKDASGHTLVGKETLV